MPDYRLYRMNPHTGHIEGAEDFHSGDDVEAILLVQGWRHLVPVELWCGGRKVMRLDAVISVKMTRPSETPNEGNVKRAIIPARKSNGMRQRFDLLRVSLERRGNGINIAQLSVPMRGRRIQLLPGHFLPREIRAARRFWFSGAEALKLGQCFLLLRRIPKRLVDQ